jgi:hypothetical protein
MTVNYHGILTLEIIGFFTAVIYDGKLRRYFYNIGTWTSFPSEVGAVWEHPTQDDAVLSL